MLILPDTIEKISKILDKYLDRNIILTAGKKALSQARVQQLMKLGFLEKDAEAIIDRAYWIGRLKAEGLSNAEAEEALRELQTAVQAALSPVEKAAVALARESMAQSLLKFKETVKGVVSDIILSGNYTYRNATGTVASTLEDAILRRETVGEIAIQLRDKTQDLYRDWRRVAITELTNTMNAGAVDTILRDSANEDKPANEIYVYKSIPVDEKTCAYCIKFYLEPDKKTPKVYPLSELQANGSNYGRKTAEWLPVIGSTHPHCRGYMVQLSNGWGFVVGSDKREYRNKDFLWHRDKPVITAPENKKE